MQIDGRETALYVCETINDYEKYPFDGAEICVLASGLYTRTVGRTTRVDDGESAQKEDK